MCVSWHEHLGIIGENFLAHSLQLLLGRQDFDPRLSNGGVITINCFKVYHRLAGPDKYRRVSPVCSKGEIFRFCILL